MNKIAPYKKVNSRVGSVVVEVEPCPKVTSTKESIISIKGTPISSESCFIIIPNL